MHVFAATRMQQYVAATATLIIGLVAAGEMFAPAFAALPPGAGARVDPILRPVLESQTNSTESAIRLSIAFPAPTVANDPTGSSRGETQLGTPLATDEAIYPCFIQWDPEAPCHLPESARIIGAGIATARLNRDEMEALAGDHRVQSLQAARRIHPRLDLSVEEIRAHTVHEASGTPPVYSGITGNHVLIGVVDTGVDFSHLDFSNEGQNRIHAVWDQTDTSINSPASFGYGREWTQAELQAGSATEIDPAGHGTHVLGIAAGTGAATGNGESAYQFVGVAPAAQIVFVKTDFWTSSIVDGVDYVFRKADELGMPAVVNLSLGHHYGPHDGTEVTDLAINALVKPGKIVVAAAGNEQESGIHAEALVGTDSQDVTFTIPNYVSFPGAGNDVALIDGYYTSTEKLTLTIRTPGGTVIGPIGPGESADTATPDGGVKIENDVFDPTTEDRNFFVQVYDKTAARAPASGTWTITFENVTHAFAHGFAQVDMWMYYQSIGVVSPPMFVEGMTATKLIGSPATADSSIAVAAYVTRNSWPSIDGNSYSYNPPPEIGSIAPFSSHGPRRDGVQKPDIAAPGMGIGAALSTEYSAEEAWILPDGAHFITQGTSMACPHVTGVVALMLESSGDLSRAEVLSRLQTTSRADNQTDTVPNSIWGFGKIDASSATETPTPILLAGIEVERTAEAIELTWSVPQGAGSIRFEVERATGTGQPGANPQMSEREFVAKTATGPDYLFEDEALLEHELVQYWLTPIENGHLGESYGPISALWEGDELFFSLSEPTPNPARGEVRWGLTLPEEAPVRIELYNLQGRRVRTLLDEVLPAGVQRFAWDGRNDGGQQLGSGVYWLRGSSPNATDSKRILILR